MSDDAKRGWCRPCVEVLAMGRIPEVGEEGTLTLDPETLGDATPRTRFAVDRQGGALVLWPLRGSVPFGAAATREERVKRLHEWANAARPPAPDLSDELLSREGLYD